MAALLRIGKNKGNHVVRRAQSRGYLRGLFVSLKLAWMQSAQLVLGRIV
jgi:hypothetical protein